MTEVNQPPIEPPVPEEWLELAEEWIGQEESPWRDEGSEPRGGGPTQTFGRLETVNEWGVVIDEEHSGVLEGVLAFYPWRSVGITKVSELDTRLAPLSSQRWVA